MKTFIAGLLFLGFASLCFAQDEESSNISLEGVTLTSANADYIFRMQDPTTPEPVKALEAEAASYDVSSSPVFDELHEAYKVFFKNSQGRIVATFDHDGRILKAFEKFRNLQLPYEVSRSVAETFPGWSIDRDVYLASYFRDKDVEKIYLIEISFGDKKKRIKSDPFGNLLK